MSHIIGTDFFHIIGNGSERLIEFVGERGRQRPHCGHARHMCQLCLKIMQSPLCRLPLGQIPYEACKNLFGTSPCLADMEVDGKDGAIATSGSGYAPNTTNPPLSSG